MVGRQEEETHMTSADDHATPIDPNVDPDHDLDLLRGTQLDDLDLELLQTTVDRIVTDIDRWNQKFWCDIRGEIDLLTEDNLDTGVYHDFTLEPQTIETLKSCVNSDGTVTTSFLPVADCGTAFCVAGDVAVMTGHTFVAERFSNTAWGVVPTAQLQPFLRREPDEDGHDIMPVEADVVARRALRISMYHANLLFDGGNDIYQVLAAAFLISQGRLVLPDAVPAKRDKYNDLVTSATTTPENVRRKVMRAAGRLVLTKPGIHPLTRFIDLDVIDPAGTSHFWNLQLDRLRDIVSDFPSDIVLDETD